MAQTTATNTADLATATLGITNMTDLTKYRFVPVEATEAMKTAGCCATDFSAIAGEPAGIEQHVSETALAINAAISASPPAIDAAAKAVIEAARNFGQTHHTSCDLIENSGEKFTTCTCGKQPLIDALRAFDAAMKEKDNA